MEENKFIHFFSKHWSKVLLGFLAVACVAAWTERFLGSNQYQSKQDFLIASQILEQFHKGETLAEESIEMAENILNRHPELHPTYDSILAHTFFAQSNRAKGIQYAKSLIEHVGEQLPSHYQTFAQASLLISEENYQAAFDTSVALNKKIEGQLEYQALDAMNTLRLLFLASQLDKKEEWAFFWNKLQHHAHYETIQSIFQEGNVSLSDYIVDSV